jgi:serine/threonine-protein kinase RsbT
MEDATGVPGMNDDFVRQGDGLDWTIPISAIRDVLVARQRVRLMASQLGFSATDVMLVAAAISELARNIVLFARKGEIELQPLGDQTRRGILLIARGEGRGVADLRADEDEGRSASGRTRPALNGVQRLMDECEIVSTSGGTIVSAKKWSG